LLNNVNGHDTNIAFVFLSFVLLLYFTNCVRDLSKTAIVVACMDKRQFRFSIHISHDVIYRKYMIVVFNCSKVDIIYNTNWSIRCAYWKTFNNDAWTFWSNIKWL